MEFANIEERNQYILDRAKNGDYQSTIAQSLGISPMTISNVLKKYGYDKQAEILNSKLFEEVQKRYLVLRTRMSIASELHVSISAVRKMIEKIDKETADERRERRELVLNTYKEGYSESKVSELTGVPPITNAI